MSGHQIENCASIIEATMINKTSAVSEAEGYVLGNLESLLNTVFIILLVPLCNSFLFPLLGFYLPNMRKRIGFGVIVLVLTSVATTFLELNVWESPEIRLLWFVLPVFLVSFAEVSTIIPCKCCLCLAYHHNYYHGDYLYTQYWSLCMHKALIT